MKREERMSDLIDRQAAIDALKAYFSDEGRTETEYGAYWHHVHVLEVLEHMPSVTPEPYKENGDGNHNES